MGKRNTKPSREIKIGGHRIKIEEPTVADRNHTNGTQHENSRKPQEDSIDRDRSKSKTRILDEKTSYIAIRNMNQECVRPDNNGRYVQYERGISRTFGVLRALGAFITILVSLVTVANSYVAINISRQSTNIANINTPLTHTSRLIKQKLSKPISVKVKSGSPYVTLKFPIIVESVVKTGEPIHVYAVVKKIPTDEQWTQPTQETLGDFQIYNLTNDRFLNISVQVTSQPKQIVSTPIEVYVLYVDINKNMSFDYYMLFPEYIVGGKARIVINGQAEELPDQITPISLNSVRFTNFDLLSPTAFRRDIAKHADKFTNIPKYDVVKSQGEDIMRLFASTPLVKGE